VVRIAQWKGLYKSLVGLRQERSLSGIHSAEQFHAVLEREKARAERNSHQFSLVRFDVGKMRENIPQIRYLTRSLTNRIRWTDEVGWLDDECIGVILPETSAVGAERFAKSVCEMVASKCPPPEYTIYTYPSASFPNGNGHSPQLNFADLFPEWGTDVSRDVSASASAGHHERRSCAIDAKKHSAHITPNHSTWPHELELFLRRQTRVWKRAFDMPCSIVALVIFSPLFLLVSLLIKLVSEGPVFFKQPRVGYKGQTFTMWKFRTFKVNADVTEHKQYVTELINSATQNDTADEKKPMTKLDNPSKRIPFGKILRKMCIDELPQLINVIRGEMSLVGPRPPIAYEVEQYSPWHHRRFDALPGMTGLWQVSGKNRLTFNEMVRLDIRYSRTNSLWLDVKIILKTPLVIISQIKDALQGSLWAQAIVRTVAKI